MNALFWLCLTAVASDVAIDDLEVFWMADGRLEHWVATPAELDLWSACLDSADPVPMPLPRSRVRTLPPPADPPTLGRIVAVRGGERAGLYEILGPWISGRAGYFYAPCAADLHREARRAGSR